MDLFEKCACIKGWISTPAPVVRSGSPNFIPLVRSGPFGPIRKLYTTINDCFYVYVKHYAHIIGRNVITSKLPPHLYQELIIEEELPLLLTLVTLYACG